MKINGEFVLREIAGEIILVPIGKTALKMNGMITLDPVAGIIWKALEEEKKFDEILTIILDKFDVTEEVAKSDLEEFLEQMKKAMLLVE